MNDALIHEIVVRFRGGASIRRIAQSLHLSRRTVRRVLDRIEQARGADSTTDLSPLRPRRGSQLDAHQDAITDFLARYPDITTQRIHEELRRLGYQGSYSLLCQHVRELRPRPVVQPVRRFETAPGQQAQMDYSTYDIDFTTEGRRRLYAFSYILGYSRRQYLHFVECQDFPTTIRQHIRAFEHLGGVAATCLYDNMKVVVSSYDGDEPVYNPRFLAFAAHYGFRPIACRPRRAQTKGKVERPFSYVESSLLGGRSFRSLEHLNESATWWLAEVADVHVHRQIGVELVARSGETVHDGRGQPRPPAREDRGEARVRRPLVQEHRLAQCRRQLQLRLEDALLDRPRRKVAVEIEAAFSDGDAARITRQLGERLLRLVRIGVTRIVRMHAAGGPQRRVGARQLERAPTPRQRGARQDQRRHASLSRARNHLRAIVLERRVRQVHSNINQLFHVAPIGVPTSGVEPEPCSSLRCMLCH